MNMNEPSVLDYIKAKLKFWEKSDLHFPGPEEDKVAVKSQVRTVTIEIEPQVASPKLKFNFKHIRIPWRSLIAIIVAFIAQGLLEPPKPSNGVALALYAAAIAMLTWSVISKEWIIAENLDVTGEVWQNFKIRWPVLLAGTIFSILAFVAFSGDVFDFINLALWCASIICFLAGFLEFRPIKAGFKRIFDSIRAGKWRVNIGWGTILLFAVVILIIFFRTYQLNTVPPEMTSDHAEKLMDIQDILDGQWSIFFQRNTGREAFQFYWTILIMKLFNTGISFISLKIGMVAAGLLTLPYLYLIAKEFWNKRVAFLAIILAGIAFWPNVISRVGLRFALYPLFTAPALYYLLRGLKNGNRNDFVWAGIAIGLGLHGYSPYRAVPILLVFGVFLFIFHRRNRANWEKALFGTIMMGVTSTIVAIPLIRYAIHHPDVFTYRLATRLGEVERLFPGNPFVIFLDNLKNAMLMFGVNDGNTWLHSITYRPALDVITAALFYLGMVLLVVRYIQKRNWLDIFLVLSVPILMLPSILSIAFPEENPVLNRTAGAIIPVYLIIALCLDGLLTSIERMIRGRLGKVIAFLIAAVLIFSSARQNYDFLFDTYEKNYLESSGNTSEMGHVIRSFADSVGTPDTAWVVGYPYWVDTRLVSIEAGFPIKDYAIWPQNFEETKFLDAPKLFILNTQDNEDLNTLLTMYPKAKVTTFTSKAPGRDFLIMLVGPGN
jgi:hypothetical protein